MIKVEEPNMKQGWLGKQKGIRHVDWERGMIDVSKLNEYSLHGKKHQLDEFVNIKEQCKKHVLTPVLAKPWWDF